MNSHSLLKANVKTQIQEPVEMTANWKKKKATTADPTDYYTSKTFS